MSATSDEENKSEREKTSSSLLAFTFRLRCNFLRATASIWTPETAIRIRDIGLVTFYCKCVTFTVAKQYLHISYQNPKQGKVTQNHTFFRNLRWTLYFVPASSLTLNLPLIVTLAPFLSGTGSGEIVMSLIFTGEPPSITEYVKWMFLVIIL